MNTDRPTDKDELITLAQAAQRYGFRQPFLRQLARRGRLKARKLGNFWVTTIADVEAYLASRQRRGRYTRGLLIPRFISGQIDVSHLPINTGGLDAT